LPRYDDFIVFADESGDHGMLSIDADYPVFVLVFCVFSKEAYANGLAPAVTRLKFRHFGHDQVILHEMDIRKSRGDFAFLRDASRRGGFLEDVNALMREAPFTLVASAIHKARHRDRYAAPGNPYHVAMEFGLERVKYHLQELGCDGGVTHMVFERRGQREDGELEAEFRRICGGGNYQGERLPFEIVLRDKKCNSPGLQVADLVARPIGRHVLAPAQPNRAFEIIEPKFRRSPTGRIPGWGLKIFP
jgi:Protein of unknown function (DUF3800)